MIRQRFTKQRQKHLRQTIWNYLTARKLISKNGDTVSIHPSITRDIIMAYDRIYFNGKLITYLNFTPVTELRITTTIRNKAAGMLHYRRSLHGPGEIVRIILNATTFIHKWDDKESHAYMVNGIHPCDRLMAMMLVLEHELIHAIQIRQRGRSNHAREFKRLAKEIFGHTHTRHDIGISIEQKQLEQARQKARRQARRQRAQVH